MSRQSQLASLFTSLFGRPEEFYRFLVGLEHGVDVMHAIPSSVAPFAEIASQAVAAVESRGMANATFFHALVRERPLRGEAIAQVADLWLSNGFTVHRAEAGGLGAASATPLRWVVGFGGEQTIYEGEHVRQMIVSCVEGACYVACARESGSSTADISCTELSAGGDVFVCGAFVSVQSRPSDRALSGRGVKTGRGTFLLVG